MDDYSKLVTFDDVGVAVSSGNFAGFRSVQHIVSSVRNVSGNVGQTYYFGSPQSDKRLRFYDKSVESGGELDCYRWEAQFRGKHAHEAFLGFVSSGCDSLYLSGLVTGCVSFVDRDSGDRLSRLDMLPWWSDFVDKVGGFIKFSIPQMKSTIQKKKDWITKQVSATLAIIKRVYGSFFPHWLTSQIDEGDSRLTPEQISLAQVAREDYLYRNVVLT